MKKIQASTIEVSLAPPPVSYETDEDSAGEEDEGPKTIEKLNGAQLRAEGELVLRQESELETRVLAVLLRSSQRLQMVPKERSNEWSILKSGRKSILKSGIMICRWNDNSVVSVISNCIGTNPPSSASSCG
ncbi:hypothetical protein M8J75_014762 [Diaphorina citri]|nr:hypothetical protein M8J75_014762 [Diaphorina citri]